MCNHGHLGTGVVLRTLAEPGCDIGGRSFNRYGQYCNVMYVARTPNTALRIQTPVLEIPEDGHELRTHRGSPPVTDTDTPERTCTKA